jgi:hypothetical protein
MTTRAITAIAAFTLGAASLFAQATQTITGKVTDAMCGAHHMMKDATAAQCTRACIKQGADFALASSGKVYILKGDKSQFDKFAGQSVNIKGTVRGNTISVNSIETAKS